MSRSNATSRKLMRRPSRTLPATIVALVLLVLGVVTTVVAVSRLATEDWPRPVNDLAGELTGMSWGSTVVIVAAVVLMLLGVLLLVAGLSPGGLRAARLEAPDGDSVEVSDYVISTRGLARLAAARADTVDGVEGVSASATGRRVAVRVTTASEQTDEIRTRVQQAVTDALSGAGVSPAPKVSTTVRTKGL